MKTWSTVSPNSYDAPNPGTTLVGFVLTMPPNSKTETSVFLLPMGTKEKEKSKVEVLEKW
jgi:hypothetical protein